MPATRVERPEGLEGRAEMVRRVLVHAIWIARAGLRWGVWGCVGGVRREVQSKVVRLVSAAA